MVIYLLGSSLLLGKLTDIPLLEALFYHRPTSLKSSTPPLKALSHHGIFHTVRIIPCALHSSNTLCALHHHVYTGCKT